MTYLSKAGWGNGEIQKLLAQMAHIGRNFPLIWWVLSVALQKRCCVFFAYFASVHWFALPLYRVTYDTLHSKNAYSNSHDLRWWETLSKQEACCTKVLPCCWYQLPIVNHVRCDHPRRRSIFGKVKCWKKKTSLTHRCYYLLMPFPEFAISCQVSISSRMERGIVMAIEYITSIWMYIGIGT